MRPVHGSAASRFATRFDAFRRQVELRAERVDSVRRRANASDKSKDELESLTEAALRELSRDGDEFLAIEEELCAQIEELEGVSRHAATQGERYRELFESSSDPYIVTDRLGNIRDVNARAAYVLDAPHKYFSGRPFSVFVAPEFVRMLRNVVDEATNGSGAPMSLRLRRRDGETVDAELTVRVAENGHTLFFVARPTATPNVLMESSSRTQRVQVHRHPRSHRRGGGARSIARARPRA